MEIATSNLEFGAYMPHAYDCNFYAFIGKRSRAVLDGALREQQGARVVFTYSRSAFLYHLISLSDFWQGSRPKAFIQESLASAKDDYDTQLCFAKRSIEMISLGAEMTNLT